MTRDRKAAAFARVARWQIESRLRNEVTLPWIEGTRLAVSRGMTGATGNIYAGLHEFRDMAFTLHFLRRGDFFADIGANVGTYTVLASGVCGARTVAFEPDPVTVAALRRNIALNRLEGVAEIHAKALGSDAGSAQFSIDRDTMNRVVTDVGEPTRTVPMETLDRALAGETPVFIKLDVEGFEPQVLRGASATLRAPTLRAILTEDRSAPVVNVLRAAGFGEHSYDPFTRRLSAGDDTSNGNALFVRDEAFVQQRLASAKPFRVLGRTL